MKRALALALLLAGCAAAPADPAGDDDSGDVDQDPGDGDLVDGDPLPVPGCTSVTTVVLYSEATYELRLPLAFAAVQDPCTRYLVQLPALTADKTMPRPDADAVHQLGPNFFALAEFSWHAWAKWVGESPGTRDFAAAGKLFRRRMAEAGYDVAGGDSWVINEFPSTTRTGEANVWNHEQDAVRGLYEGVDGVTSQGVVFIAGMGEHLVNFSLYKPNLSGWLKQTAFWTAMKSYVRWFSYEVYADPHFDCVVGSNVVADAEHLNAYLEHLPRLAFAGGDATVTAANYLKRSFLPLLSAAWNSDNGFGDNRIALAQFAKYSRLQIYATHVWAAHHPYPGRRIGFAWAPKNSTRDDDIALADVIANAVTRSYPANAFYNLGKYACSVDGSLDGCGCTVSGAQYNTRWNQFATF